VWSVVVQTTVRIWFCLIPIDGRLQENQWVTSQRISCAVVKIVGDTASV